MALLPHDLAGLFEDVARITKTAIEQACERLLKRIEALESKIAEIETRGVRYRGVYQKADDYRRGDMVTADGSLWVCVAPTSDAPGKSPSWQLAAQKGRRWQGCASPGAQMTKLRDAIQALQRQSERRGFDGYVSDGLDVGLAEDERTVVIYSRFDSDEPLVSSYELAPGEAFDADAIEHACMMADFVRVIRQGFERGLI